MNVLSRRKIRLFATIGILATFILVEAGILSYAKYNYDHRESIDVADEISLQLSLINAALQSGNDAAYINAVTKFRAELDVFGDNNYVKGSAQDLLRALQEYSATLLDDSNLITEMMELRVAFDAISTATTEAQNANIDATQAYAIANDYKDFHAGLERISSAELQDIKSKLVSMSEELARAVENSAACITICPEETLLEKQNTINEIVTKYQSDLEALSSAVSQKYNPNQLILDLNDYSKL